VGAVEHLVRQRAQSCRNYQPTVRAWIAAALLACSLSVFCASAHAAQPGARELPAGLQIPAAAQPGPDFDVDRATAAYIDLLSPAQRAASDAYFEGGYWLQLWSLLYGLAVAALLLWAGLSQRMRDLTRRWGRRVWPGTALYAVFYVLLTFVLSLSLSIYSGFVREHQYELSEQSFGGWMRDQLVGLAVTVVLGTVAVCFLYAVLRRAGRIWWTWASVLTFVALLILLMISPVFISPLFNRYQPVPAGEVRDAVLSMARANQIPTEHLDWFDASKQTTRVSANVSGLWGTTRINLNDNLLEKTSLPEIKAVLGHEMGHYVLNHVMKMVVYFSVLFTGILLLTHWLLDGALARWGEKLQLSGRADVAALPLLVAIASLLLFVFTPAFNTIIREDEIEADAFGLNAAREPQGFAMVAMRLSSYRKISPTPLEEILFFDHPSGYHRVHASMLWQKENLPGAVATTDPAPAALPSTPAPSTR
jgi:STE24 endopeptidase